MGPNYFKFKLTLQIFQIVTVIHHPMLHHHSMLHSYNIPHGHPILKINRQKHSNILNDPPHKISSKTDNFWMYYSQIISGCYVFPPVLHQCFTCISFKNNSMNSIFWKYVLVDFRQIFIFKFFLTSCKKWSKQYLHFGCNISRWITVLLPENNC